jgi:predicted adenine nucleotide alpha hydrolase (AANH) superfamily ATPase
MEVFMSKQDILLHACCATCAGYVLEKLRTDYRPIIYYFNPNIFPLEEYQLRRNELEIYARTQNIPFIEEAYLPQEWSDQIKGLENEPEKGRRCERCFRLRLSKTASYALQNRIPLYTTTLTISPHKNSKMILRIGQEIADANHLTFLAEDFKKQEGFKKTMEIARSQGFYRQNYCGCLYSQL